MKARKTILTAFIMLVVSNLFAQSYYYRSYSSNSSYSYYSSYTYVPPSAGTQLVNLAGNIYNDVVTRQEREKQKLEAEEKMRKKVQQIKTYYESIGEYPNTVTDGWHDVVILGGEEYIDDRKVYVEKNKIKKMVCDNWFELEVNFSGPIKKGKTGVQIKNGKGPEEGILDAYFINYIADSTSHADEPLKAGTVTFWSNHKKAENLIVRFEEVALGKLQHRYDHDKAPECGNDAEFNIIYKPGVYTYEAYLNPSPNLRIYGKPICKGKVTIPNGGCVRIQLNEESKMTKD